MRTSRLRTVSLAALAVGALAGATGTAPPVAASSATAPTVEIVGNAIVFTAAPGVDDGVIIFGTEDGTLGFGGVTGTGTTSTTCPGADCDITGIDRLVMFLGDGDDHVYADIPWHIPALRFVIHGGPGDDVISGNAGYADKLFGGAGDDYIRGYSGADLIVGGTGKDTLRGARGDDDLRGGAGADVVRGGAGHDTLRGQRGADTLSSADGTRDHLYGGAGRDTASVDHRDVLVNIERLS